MRGSAVEGELWIGLVFACATALATNLAFLWKHRGAVAAPAIDMRRPVRSATELFRSKWWTIGWAVAVFGWAFHVGALAFAPLSLAQAVISGGFVVLAVLAERLFGFELGRRQWLGIALVAAGLGFLGATSETTAQETRYSVIGIAAFQGVLLAVGLLLILITRLTAVRRHGRLGGPEETRAADTEHPRTGGPPQAPVTAHETRVRRSKTAGLLLAVAAGLAFGISDVSIKALAEQTLGDVFALISPWTATALIASLGAFYASARSLQIGEGMAVITATTASANMSTIAGGIIVFGEALGHSVLEALTRLVAFLLVVAGAALMPGPMRAAEAAAREEREEAPPPRRPKRGSARKARAQRVPSTGHDSRLAR
jgi:drug/metabolite transporter (DMT)-like permease